MVGGPGTAAVRWRERGGGVAQRQRELGGGDLRGRGLLRGREATSQAVALWRRDRMVLEMLADLAQHLFVRAVPHFNGRRIVFIFFINVS